MAFRLPFSYILEAEIAQWLRLCVRNRRLWVQISATVRFLGRDINHQLYSWTEFCLT